MPYLVNGCGTHYYGKKNIQKRPGPCPHCGRAVELMSYDTRKWFVILLIPIVPLGRLRILDYCSACTRHYALGVDKWDAARQLEVSGAMEKYRANPTPEAAMEAHQQLLNFHQLEDAAAFRKLMREKYADNAKVHAYLGAALERFGQPDEARGCYQRAYELRPDLPEARIGVARGHIQTGRLTEARALLDFMEKPGAAQLYSLEPLDTLARAFQGAERHEDALALFTIIQRELPHLNEQRWFRDLIRKSEKALNRSDSLLPKQSFSWKRFFAAGNASTARTLIVCGIFIALIALGFIIVNEYVRRNRTVRIVNAYRQQATVQLSSQRQPIFVQGVSEVTLSEGDYHATITGPVKEDVDFSIRESYWSRWFGDPVWVLNIGGAAILELSHVTYAKNDPPPPQYTFFYGESFYRFPDVEYAFRELPEKLEVQGGGTRQVTHLDIMSNEPLALFYYFSTQKNYAEAFRLAEWQLRKQPEDEKMVALYAQTAVGAKQATRAEKFLRAGLTNRPVRVQWHRYYQNLRRDESRDAELAAQYRAELATDPTNSALMYLLGRVVPTRTESRLWFERACTADTNNAFAFYASAYDRCSVGDWGRARQLLTHACALQPDQFEFTHQLGRVRFALGEYPELEKELRQELSAHPLSFNDCRQLCEVLVAQGKAQEAITYADNFRRHATAEGGARIAASNQELECEVLYLTGNFEKLRDRTAGRNDEFNKYQCFIAQIESGHVLEAVKLLPPKENTADNPFHFLNTAIALRAAGETAEATRWLELGLTALEKGDADWKRAAKWLRNPAPKFVEHEEFSLPAESKVTVLTTLAQTSPALRAELLPLIAKLNVLPGYPQHLIQTATAQLK